MFANVHSDTVYTYIHTNPLMHIYKHTHVGGYNILKLNIIVRDSCKKWRTNIVKLLRLQIYSSQIQAREFYISPHGLYSKELEVLYLCFSVQRIFS